MTFESLQAIAENNDVIIVDHDNYTRTPPHYYFSLRHALGFYFNTFNTINERYDVYSRGLSEFSSLSNKDEFLDEENTVLAIVAFERFFELFFKSILSLSHEKLAHTRAIGKKRNVSIEELVDEIHKGTFQPKQHNGKPLTIPFRETIDRFYNLVELHKKGSTNPIVMKFGTTAEKYPFLDTENCKASMRLLNWYRDRILHNGNKLPSLWMLDYFVTQHLIPFIAEITHVEKEMLGESLFYFETETKINVIEELNTIKYDFEELFDKEKQEKICVDLLFIGHFKELGRANLNMNLFMRRNIQATYEYNYKDPKGRGIRFAKAEKNEHPNAVKIHPCPCCGVESLVAYQESIDNIFHAGEKKLIDWIKCYTCQYHIRYNVGDPHVFGLSEKELFGNDVKRGEQ